MENWVWSLGWEDALEKGMATHSSILAWKIPWTEKPGGLYSKRSQVRHDWATNTHTHTHTQMLAKLINLLKMCILTKKYIQTVIMTDFRILTVKSHISGGKKKYRQETFMFLKIKTEIQALGLFNYCLHMSDNSLWKPKWNHSQVCFKSHS